MTTDKCIKQQQKVPIFFVITIMLELSAVLTESVNSTMFQPFLAKFSTFN